MLYKKNSRTVYGTGAIQFRQLLEPKPYINTKPGNDAAVPVIKHIVIIDIGIGLVVKRFPEPAAGINVQIYPVGKRVGPAEKHSSPYGVERICLPGIVSIGVIPVILSFQVLIYQVRCEIQPRTFPGLNDCVDMKSHLNFITYTPHLFRL